MPTKTERIVGYLPSTFSAFPRPSALHSVVDAFGRELLSAENSLAALMGSHWVDHADRGAELIDDLACFARLYGLAPRGAVRREGCGPLAAEESVEEFREHLRRYVRTFLEGTATVQGVLRVAAEALGLRIADDYADLDAWWSRRDDGLTTVEPRPDDAANALLGFGSAGARGEPSRPARVVGDQDLSGGVDLSGASVLRLKVDDDEPVEIDLAARLGKTEGATLDEIAAAINDALGRTVATHDGRRLTLASPTRGMPSRLEVQEPERDAAPRLLGVPPHIYRGAAATPAQITGLVDLSGVVDLRDARYLRLLVDETMLAEIDCAGATPSRTRLGEIVQAINDAFAGQQIASAHDGRFLRLTSPTVGFASSIVFQEPAAGDARARLFGPVATVVGGQDARPAVVHGKADLRAGVDLSGRSKLRIRIDDQPAVVVDCRGEDPKRTRPEEIVAALDEGLGVGVASHDGRRITLRSPGSGPESSISFEPLPPEQNATDLILGLRRRAERGSSAVRARLVGERNLSRGFDAAAVNKILVAVDGAAPVEVSLLGGERNARAVTLDELSAAINRGLGAEVATHDGERLILVSPTAGGASRVAVEPLLVTRRRRFVTRAHVLDDAALQLFGFVARESRGEEATRARVEGANDLSRGVDLRAANFLRLSVDDWPFVEIDCAGPRPRATTLEEVISKINARLAAVNPEFGGAVAAASGDGQRLVLASPTSGGGSRIAFEPPRSVDALDLLLGLEPQSFAGRGATRISFVGTARLGPTVDLSDADRIKLGVDDAPTVEINCADPDSPANTPLDHVVSSINAALGKSVAGHDGARITLTSELTGAGSRIEFAAPPERDATAILFGIRPPRVYAGAAAEPARAVGVRDLSEGADVRVGRFIRMAVDGRPTVEVDLAAPAADPAHATLAEIKHTINASLGSPIASDKDGRLILASPSSGEDSRLELFPTTGSDARAKLFGDVVPLTKGSEPAPAVIEGEVELAAPLDFSDRRTIRLAADDARHVDLDVAGAAPGATTPDEVVARINAVFPRMASITERGRLRLASPTRGGGGRLALLPVRSLELIEYPPGEAADPPAVDGNGEPPAREVRHGDRWFVTNDGAADADLEVELSAPHGTVGAQIVNRTTGHRVRLLTVIRPGERLRLSRDAGSGLRAVVVARDGAERPVPPAQILAGPLGAQAHIHFRGQRTLSDGGPDSPATLQLNNPLAPVVVMLRAQKPGREWNRVGVSVTKAELQAAGAHAYALDGSPARLVGRVRADAGGHLLADAGGAALARLSAGPGVELDAHVGRVSAARGRLYESDDATPLLFVERIDELFDVKLTYAPEEGEPVSELYPGVLVGTGEEDPEGLVWQINRGPSASALVRASEADKSAALVLPRGRSHWSYLDCHGSRFDRSRFDAWLAGRRCTDRAVFNFSRFARRPPDEETVVFAAAVREPEPPVGLRFRWSPHLPGSFVVNLPEDLPPRFGGRFNHTHFGVSKEGSEFFEGIYTEPGPDENPDHLVSRLKNGPKTVGGEPAPGGSTLVNAEIVERLPRGFEAVTIPFRKPRPLAGGAEDETARLYLVERDVPGFIKLSARTKGAWGNAITVAARKAGPARFDVTVSYAGARFENARRAALGGEQLPTLAEEALRPGPVGVLQAKAAGVRARVTRTRAHPEG